MSKFDDERIAKLPKWAQDLFQQAAEADRSATYWRDQFGKASAEHDKTRTEYAQTNGRFPADTWVTEELDGGSEAAFGLGVGRPVEFGGEIADGCGDFTITYRDGGLDIRTMRGDLVIKPRLHTTDGPDIRIE